VKFELLYGKNSLFGLGTERANNWKAPKNPCKKRCQLYIQTLIQPSFFF